MKNLKKFLFSFLMIMTFVFGGLLSVDVNAKGKKGFEDDDNVPGVDGCSIILPEPEVEVAGTEDPEDESETSSDEESEEDEDK